MSALEKLVKALEALKIIKDSSATVTDESAARRKEKVSLCGIVADTMCSPAVKSAPNFPSLLSFSMETLFLMCDDQDSNIRLVADECLNRIIRAMMDNNIVKVQVELHKEIKKNGSVRSLRAALWRFGQLAHMIRPQKGKPYVQNLVPCIVEIAKRKEEPVLETLASALQKILAALGNFTTDSDIKKLLKAFLTNLSSDVTVVRRTAATSILSICLHCRKPHVFLTYTLNTLIDSVVPIKEDQSSSLVLGVLNCLRLLLPHLSDTCEANDNGLRGSFGVRRSQQDTPLGVDRLIQVYELCLYWTHDPDHNVVTAALETLHQLLTHASPELLSVLLSPQGLTRSRILPAETEKLSRRTLSEMSVATSVAAVDETSLLDMPDETLHSTRLVQWVHDSNPPAQFTSGNQHEHVTGESDTEYTTSEFESMPPILVGTTNTMERAPSLESDLLIGRENETPSPDVTDIPVPAQVWEIGTVVDTGQVALLYCCRRLVTGFLLPDSAPGVRVRVSVRALALQCVSQVVRLLPTVFLLPVDLNKQSSVEGFSHVSDVLCFSSHSDPQLRGLTRILISCFVRSALIESGGSYCDWLNRNTLKESISDDTVFQISSNTDDKIIPLEKIITVLVSGLEDESSVCVRHTLAGLSICLSELLCSRDCSLSLPILNTVTQVAGNSYWLVKVKLIALLSDLSYLNLHFVTGSCEYQMQILNNVILALLADQDNRVRKSAAEALVKIVKNLYFPIDDAKEDVVTTAATRRSRGVMSGLFESSSDGRVSACSSTIESSLSRLISLLSCQLLQSSSKDLTAGCCEALCLLSAEFPTTAYKRAWQSTLGKVPVDLKPTVSAASGLLGVTVALLTTAPASLDLDTQNWLLKLAGNLYTGLAVSALKNLDVKMLPETKQIWGGFMDNKLAVLSEALLNHVLRVLCVFVKVLEETPATRGPIPSPIRRRPTRSSSPVKTTSAADKESGRDEKGRLFGNFIHLPHYTKMYDNLRSAYANYKMVLECSDKLAGLLHSVLHTLSQILEYATLTESGRIADEVLIYLRTTVALEPTASVIGVQQLLKSLFGANQIAQWEDDRGVRWNTVVSVTQSEFSGYYGNVFQYPYQQLTDYIDENNKPTVDHNKGLQNRNRERKATSIIKGLGRNSDRTALASYIRLFEPMVIQALKQYTVTSDVALQVTVLELLTQLIQLRVNYCLLDSDQVFIKFVLKQFELLELGQIQNAEFLIPKIFQFLVHLSYEKNHSKPVISVEKVIQLCDGLMASGQNSLTHCIPALLPVVEHVFLATSCTDLKQLEAQREVVLAMLLRLAEYHQVLRLLSLILSEGWRWEERWRRWSRQTADVLLPLLAQDRVKLDSLEALTSLLSLLHSFAPGTLRPVDAILRVLFTVHESEDHEKNMRHISTTLAMLVYIICHCVEDSVLARLEDLKLCVREQGDDPLNVTAASQNDPPQTVMARLILRVLYNITSRLHTSVNSCSFADSEAVTLLERLQSHFLLCCLHMFQSGSFLQVATALINLIQETEVSTLSSINEMYISLSAKCPVLTLLWCYLLTLLSYGNTDFWAKVMDTKDSAVICRRRKSESSDNKNKISACLNLEVVKRGATILFCDYVSENVIDGERLTWLLVGHIEELISLSDEPPVLEWLAAVNRNPAASVLMVQAIATRCSHIKNPSFVCHLLKCLEMVHPSDSGATLLLLTPTLVEHPHLAPARRAAALACRRAEYLLTLEKEEVLKQLGRDDLLRILKTLTRSACLARKHSGLISLLNKLAAQYYDVSPVELDQGRTVNTANISSIVLDKTWFLTQVKLRCCQMDSSAKQCAQLLSQLERDDIASVLRSQQFNNAILQHCFILGAQLTLQGQKTGDDKKYEDGLSPLYSAARLALLQHIHHFRTLLPRMHQIYKPIGRIVSTKEAKYMERINELFMDSEFSDVVFRLIPAVTSYLLSLSDLCNGQSSQESLIPRESWEDLAKFGVLCLEAVHWLLDECTIVTNWPSLVYCSLDCAVNILCLDQLAALLTSTHLGSIVTTLLRIVKMSTGTTLALPNIPDYSGVADAEMLASLHTCHQIAALVTWFEKTSIQDMNIPEFLVNSVKHIVMSMGRCSFVNWYCRTPPDVWSHLQLSPNSPPPPLPTHLLQDIELLHQIVFRIALFGWTSRQQFEETWMSLLSVLSSNPSPDSEQDEINAIMQANSVAVQAITSLLIQTTLIPIPGNPNTGTLAHVSRDTRLDLTSYKWGSKLEEATETLCWKLSDYHRILKTNVHLKHLHQYCNLERLFTANRYLYGQVSVNFLETAVMTPDERASASNVCKAYLKHEERLTTSGLDLHSCLQFLLDLYSQWTQPESGVSLSLLLEVVRSTVSLSDLFTERSHFSWMLETFLDLSRTHPQEDEILHQYLVVAVCKAAGVLPTLETEEYDRVIRLIDSSLKSAFPPMRLSAAHGLLYLFQSTSFMQSEENTIEILGQKVPQLDNRQRIIQLALDFINKNFSNEANMIQSEETQLVTYALIFYMLEHVPQELPQDMLTALTQLAKTTSSTQQMNLYQTIIQGLNRLILTGKSTAGEQCMWLVVDRLAQPDPATSLPSLQLLLTCIYSCEYGKVKCEDGVIDPEQLVATMEKTSALFDRIKKGCPLEVECVCSVLPCLLADFFPASEVLTKVFSEFLSPHQPHPRLVSAVVFQVLSQACREFQLPLLQAWVVMSLNNFTQALPVAMAMWCLSCFFISASINPWLRAIFPYVQSRIGRCSYEDRKLLCIAASDFYRQLTDDSQKDKFVKTFKEAATSPRSPFSDVIASL